MAALAALYLQDPFWLWLAAGCLFVSLNLATGSGLAMAPAMAAVAVALVELAGLRMSLAAEIGAFVVLCLGAGAVLVVLKLRARVATGPAGGPVRPPGPTTSGRQEQTARLIGRIGRSAGEFVNGVGRVWIDGAEWGAELDGGDEVLPAGVPVRVTKVIGGIRLQVHALTSG